jgi:site-specific recombinase XerD
VVLYLTFLAYKTGGLAAVNRARGAMRYYAKLQGEEGNYMKDPQIETVVKGLERDFAKPIQQKEGFSPEEMRKIIKYFLREKICPKLVDLRMACLLLLLYLSAGRFEEAAGIELENIKMLESGNLMIQLLKGKKNQLAKRQTVILPKMDTSECKEMDITVLMKTYVEKLEDQDGKSKYLFPSCWGTVKGREGNRLKATFLLEWQGGTCWRR